MEYYLCCSQQIKMILDNQGQYALRIIQSFLEKQVVV